MQNIDKITRNVRWRDINACYVYNICMYMYLTCDYACTYANSICYIIYNALSGCMLTKSSHKIENNFVHMYMYAFKWKF